ncbi:MAG: hypothetical protein JXA53_09280 [Bacteroidales bacterium]|nr:hypothetical protein [Bacteroidales bacterium]
MGRSKSELKLYLILSTTIVFAILAWNLAISETLDVRSQYITIKSELDGSSGLNVKMNNVSSELEQYSSLIGDISSSESGHEDILSETTKLCEKYSVRIVEFPKINITTLSNDQIFTSKVVIEGTTFNLLRMLKDYEENSKTGCLVSVRFARLNDKRTGTVTCLMTMFIENIKHLDK